MQMQKLLQGSFETFYANIHETTCTEHEGLMSVLYTRENIVVLSNIKTKSNSPSLMMVNRCDMRLHGQGYLCLQ